MLKKKTNSIQNMHQTPFFFFVWCYVPDATYFEIPHCWLQHLELHTGTRDFLEGDVKNLKSILKHTALLKVEMRKKCHVTISTPFQYNVLSGMRYKTVP